MALISASRAITSSPQAVGTGADGQAHNFLRGDGLAVELPQLFHGSVGIGEGLEIGYVFAVAIFAANPALGPLQLDFDGIRAALSELTAAGAEDTAPGAQGTVPVGAGKAPVQRELIDLTAEGFLIMLG